MRKAGLIDREYFEVEVREVESEEDEVQTGYER
jgi:hypothetical protein